MNANTLRLLLIGGLIAGAVYGGTKLVSAVRGIRNNNPGNIRDDGTAWLGRVPADQQTDTEFVQFTDPRYGIRAIAKVLQAYAARGLNTLAQIGATWAPPNENDTTAYVNSLAALTGFAPGQALTSAQYPAVIAAITRIENGIQPYDSATLAAGVALA